MFPLKLNIFFLGQFPFGYWESSGECVCLCYQLTVGVLVLHAYCYIHPYVGYGTQTQALMMVWQMLV